MASQHRNAGQPDKSYRRIVAHYEACLARHGDSHLGVDWPDAADAATRYQVMIGVIREPAGTPVSLLDFGCGAGHLLEHIRAHGPTGIDYRGLDLSSKFIDLCRRKFPEMTFYETDILDDAAGITPVDYVIMNGVFTEKRDLSQAAMQRYMELVLGTVWPLAGKGVAFNVMSTQVDWQRDDLFHLPLETLAAFLSKRLSRHFVFRHDYGLYDYTAYLYRQPHA